MLQITIPETELWDERKQEFSYIKGTTLSLEHSLVSLSKWESKYHKPFLSKEDKTNEETLYYIKCMTITQNVDPNVYLALTNAQYIEINNYIGDSMTRTWFGEDKTAKKGREEQITSELIYYWMIALQIPFECQKWHLNRLLTLIRVCNIKNQPEKKMSPQDIRARNAALNAERKARLHTKG